MDNTSVTNALAIVEKLRSTGVIEWSNAPRHSEDDLEYVDALSVRYYFCHEVLPAIKDSDAKLVITTKLVEWTLFVFERLIEDWPEKERAQVPTILQGITLAQEWLEIHKTLA